MPVAREHRLTDRAELLFRQAPAIWMQGGLPTSQIFRPMPKDHGLLSVDRDSVVGTPAASRRRHLALGFQSVGAWAVSVGEVNLIKLEVYADPTKKKPAHAVIDLQALAPGMQRDAAGHLRDQAMTRGALA